jgi:hypothetical protein
VVTPQRASPIWRIIQLLDSKMAKSIAIAQITDKSETHNQGLSKDSLFL